VQIHEPVVAEGGVVGTDDSPVLVDPDRGRDVDDAIEVGDAMLDVDECGMRRAGGLDPRPRVVRRAVEGDRQDGES
jgi:hypothetical protein